MKALITGGGGTLGKAIARRLLDREYDVRSFSRGSHPELEAMGVEVVRGNIIMRGDLDRAMEGCDLVFHVAARTELFGSYGAYYYNNVVGTRNVIDACRNAGIPRLVYTSTAGVVYNGRDMRGVDETAPYPRRYESHYYRTKAIAERMVLLAGDEEFAAVCLRPTMIMGGQHAAEVYRIVELAERGRLAIIGDGRNLVDTVHVDDAAAAHVLAAECLYPGSPVAGRTYFISGNGPQRAGEVIDRIMEAYGLPPVKVRLPGGPGLWLGRLCEAAYRTFLPEREPPVTLAIARHLSASRWFDISAARNDFGYLPERSFEEGMRSLMMYRDSSLQMLGAEVRRRGARYGRAVPAASQGLRA